MSGEGFDVPETATAIRLVRLVGDDLRCYEVMESEGGARAIRTLLRQKAFTPVPLGEDYGIADLLDSDQTIVGEALLDRGGFQRVKKRLGCRVEENDA